MTTRTRTRALGISIALSALLGAACVPPPAPPSTTTSTTTTTTTPPPVVPQLCSESGESPVDALGPASLMTPGSAAARAHEGVAAPEAPAPSVAPLDSDRQDEALSRDQVRALAEVAAEQPLQITGAATGLHAVTLSSVQDGRARVDHVLEVDPPAAVQAAVAIADQVGLAGGHLIGVEADRTLHGTAASGPTATSVGSTEPTAVAPAASELDDEWRVDQWSMDRYDFEDLWCASTGDGVTVAVIDSGVDADHPDLAGKVVQQFDDSLDQALDGGARYGSPGIHGTHVAGTIAAIPNNGIGVAGVAPDVELIDIKTLTAEATLGTAGMVARSIVKAVDLGADVINLSVGIPCASTEAQLEIAGEGCQSGNGWIALDLALDHADANDVLVVVAAGNDGAATVHDEDTDSMVPNPSHNIWNMPGAHDISLTVASATEDDELSPFSTQAPYVDVTGPGSDILSTGTELVDGELDRFYTEMSGTSMATPHVAALSALLRGAYPSASATAIKDLVTGTTATVGTACPAGIEPAHCFGSGIIDPAAALVAGRT